MSASTSAVSVTLDGVTFDMWGTAAIEAGLAVAFDIRGDEGPRSIFDIIRDHLAAGRAVALWDSANVMPPFSVGIIDGRHIASGTDGVLTNFVTLVAALKHGLMGCEGAWPRWWKDPCHG